MAEQQQMITKLKMMHDRAFENLAFDILALRGVQNLAWRTPGRDGGRDLEGVLQKVDFSGQVINERWYFECKRYSASISWPVVFEKISYAANAKADYLLFITTSGFSPACLDEANIWNARGSKPLIRQWPGHEVTIILYAHPKVMFKYDIQEDIRSVVPISFLELSLEIAKASQAAYSALQFGQDPGQYVELAACLADLLSARLADYEIYNRLVFSPFRNGLDAFPWTHILASTDLQVDRLAARALLASLRLSCHASSLTVEATPHGMAISVTDQQLRVPPTAAKLIDEVCFWGDIERSEEGAKVIVRQRQANV